jgi:uncharacterized protein YqjF (DUF2071 family)
VGDVSDQERLRMRERPTGRAVMRQVWQQLGFLHWPVDIEALRRLVPAALDIDLFEGVAYVGIVPFTIPQTRAVGLGAPMAPAFHEINVRTYVHRGGREPGVWFFSLDASSQLAVAGARVAYRLPYFMAEIAIETTIDPGTGLLGLKYRCGRRRSPAAFHGRYLPVGPVAEAAPGSLEFFLAERYLLYSWSGGILKTARVHHAPYPLQPGAAGDVVQTLTYVAGMPLAACQGTPPLVHYAHTVDVEIFGPRLDKERAVR